MFVRCVFLTTVLALVACHGSGDDVVSADVSADAVVDSTTDAIADSSAEPDLMLNADAELEDNSVLFRGWVTNGVTQEPVEGGELCVLEPEQDGESCGTTDAEGLVEWRWHEPNESNFTAQFTHEDYTPLLFLGHYDDAIAASWETDGVIDVVYSVFLTTVMEWWLGQGSITMDSGAGHIFLIVTGATEDTALDGITASLSDGSGTVVYWGADDTSLNSDLTASSTAGSVVIGNVAPGTYTVNIAHENLVCDNVRAWLVDVPNEYTVPVQADTVTVAHISCAAE